ncbi:hypothetical protein BACCAP_04393 [Pseudoflavonifractor capillosus ATCC 29799]|uniref:Uncharacterized protein n=1 Tax=Pseudoflavonifractor capillosus ATCC 29799 TaxID=411467 RepID=A6P1M6_9FIRM|nr:hypothetical protein BACCAP_04393 [Pseudoflavonifractor capillosus ATCC 29799]
MRLFCSSFYFFNLLTFYSYIFHFSSNYTRKLYFCRLRTNLCGL